MGKIRSGILSRVSGKVAGVVGGNWKNVAYLREYVVPANPNTTAQQAQRSKFSACVAYAKTLVGPVFQTYTDKFQKNMSGYNAFIKANIALFPLVNFNLLKVTEGPLAPPGDRGTSRDNFTVTLTWDPTIIGTNGSAADKVFGYARNPVTGQVFFPAEPVARSVGELDITVDHDSSEYQTYAWAAKYNGDILASISNSNYVLAPAV